MEWIRTIRDKYQTRIEQDIQKQAEETITLTDFYGNIFIAYLGTPLLPVEESWTQKEIINKLSDLRQNYINAKTKQLC